MSFKKFIVGMILAGTIAVSGVAPVSAINSDETIRNTPELAAGCANCSSVRSDMSRTEQIQKGQKQAIVKSALDALVKNGTITKAQEDAVLKAIAAKREKIEPEKGKTAPDGQKKHCKDEKCKHHSKKHGILNELVKDGTITKEQAAAIREAIKSARDAIEKQQ